MSTSLGRYGTPRAETEVLSAVVNDDVDHARALLQEMTPTERHALEHQCEEVINLQVLREDDE
ncbi:hypothetical protein E1286_38755 [Nonomuraea terrae]|uniref:Uncharacterized protein n=1 Tax=Nonomuraea terrae TaxID=2530383 RepID=A0A4R4XXP4_9ACTN|nr:hypothetical protein [Nonomuraea terrae]TDD36110.1 hypothetical protein E1286_38755 [Nonomuraea terrae]